MKLEAATIAQVARAAGFIDHDLTTATALAVAASGGLTQYHHTMGPPGAGNWKGLWAIDTDRWPDYTTTDLHDPHTAAQAAHALTDDCDGFGWSAVYRAGHHAPHLDHAMVEATRHLYTQPAVERFTIVTDTNRYNALSDRCRNLRATITRATTRGR